MLVISERILEYGANPEKMTDRSESFRLPCSPVEYERLIKDAVS